MPAHHGLEILAVARAFARVSEMTNVVSQSRRPPGRVRTLNSFRYRIANEDGPDDRSYTNENRERVQWTVSLGRRERKDDVGDIKTKSGHRVLFKKNFEYLKY